MSTTSVLHLDAYRGRRQQRVERTLTLLRPDPVRYRLAALLYEALRVSGADRAAVLWVEEFGPVAPKAHVLFDLQEEPARSRFDSRLLGAAWERGVPGTVDVPETKQAKRKRKSPEGPESALCVCIGSDGTRTWYLMLDAATARPPLDRGVRDMLMHLAGQCTALLIHRDLVPGEPGPGRTDGFTGFSVLSDVDAEGAVEDRITERFLIMRLVRSCLDEDLAPPAGMMGERVKDLRAELQKGEERPYWEAVLVAVAAGDMSALSRAVVNVGLRSEDVGELEGALEAFRSGYWVAAFAGEAAVALDASRYLARSLRRAGRWDDSERWYAQAVEVARLVGDVGGEALALDGQAATLRARGNIRGAARVLDEALDAASRSDNAHALGSVHQQLMTLAHLSGRGGDAIRHGWASVQAFRSRRDQLRALVSLAGILLDLGAVEVAEEAYALALERVEEGYFRAFALEGHAHAAALRGDRAEYERRYQRVQSEAWAAGGVDFQAQARLYRGRAYRALGDLDEARAWFRDAQAFAEEKGLNAYVFQAEEAIRTLDGRPAAIELDATELVLPDTALEEVRGGLGALRRELGGAGA